MTAGQLGRCPVKACPVRFLTGGNRLCGEHKREAVMGDLSAMWFGGNSAELEEIPARR